MDWKDVTTEMPDSDETVMTYESGADEPVWMGYWDSEDGVWRSVNGIRAGRVTHWGPLPEPPVVAPPAKRSRSTGKLTISTHAAP